MSQEPSLKADPGYSLSTSVYNRLEPEHYALFKRTWDPYVAQGAAQTIPEAQLRAMYEANPGGSSILTVIRKDDRWAGAIAAIATPMILADGRQIKAYQIGDFVVDPAYQGRGLGKLLVADLTRALADVPEPVFGFPNLRAAGIYFKQDYIEVRSIPLVAYPLVPTAILAWARRADRARVRELDLDAACAVADEILARPRKLGAIAKSGRYLRWRYAEMRTSTNYSFLAVEGPGGSALVVTRSYTYRHVPVQVVVDVLDDGGSALPLAEVAAAGARRGCQVGMSNVELSSPRAHPLLSMEVPRRFDPRPARLIVPPRDPESESIFRSCRFRTGDWMGF